MKKSELDPKEQKKGKRKVQVIEWLQGDGAKGMRTDHQVGGGFSIYERSQVNTKEGRISAVAWLKKLGYEHGETIEGYRVVHQPGDGRFPESFTFFPVEDSIDVPDLFDDDKEEEDLEH